MFKIILEGSAFPFSNDDFFACVSFHLAVDEGFSRFVVLLLSRPKAARPKIGSRPGIAPFAS
jgi:hypothetical protein